MYGPDVLHRRENRLSDSCTSVLHRATGTLRIGDKSDLLHRRCLWCPREVDDSLIDGKPTSRWIGLVTFG